MPRPRKPLFTRARVIAWVIALALGIVWAWGLMALPVDLNPVAALLVAMTGLFGFALGILIATGLLAGVLGFFGTRPGSISSGGGSVAPDVVFGVWVALFSLPSLLVYLGVV